MTELRNKEMIKQGTFYKLEQTFPEKSAYTYYGLYRKGQAIQAYIVGYCFDGETLEATIVAPNVSHLLKNLFKNSKSKRFVGNERSLSRDGRQAICWPELF